MSTPRPSRRHAASPAGRPHHRRAIAAGQPVRPSPHDHHGFLRLLRKQTVAAAVVGFGAFFGLATLNVVGVTAHAAATGPGASADPAADVGALPPGDFFGAAGVPVQSSGGSGIAAAPPPLLGGGSGGAMLSSGGS